MAGELPCWEKAHARLYKCDVQVIGTEADGDGALGRGAGFSHRPARVVPGGAAEERDKSTLSIDPLLVVIARGEKVTVAVAFTS